VYTMSLNRSRPSTPLRRNPPSTSHVLPAPTSLESLAPQFQDLSEAMAELAEHYKDEDLLCSQLDSFNQSFSAFLYGLKMNAYTSDFKDIASSVSFEMAKAREEQVPATNSPSRDTERQAQHQLRTQDGNMTFNTDGGSESGDAAEIAAMPEKKAPVIQKKKWTKKMLIAFADSVMNTLPLEYREKPQHRREMELVLYELRTHPIGLHVTELARLQPTLPSNRINLALLALVKAKQCIRSNNNGVLYKLDPTKYPPE